MQHALSDYPNWYAKPGQLVRQAGIDEAASGGYGFS
jgi:hypothetical protein